MSTVSTFAHCTQKPVAILPKLLYSNNMRLSLCRLFDAMSGDNECKNESVDFTSTGNGQQGELFDQPDKKENCFLGQDMADFAIITSAHSSAGMDPAILPPNARRLFELSVNALEAIVHAWMSELPITAEIIRFGKKILTAANMVTGLETAQRQAAETAAADRGDPDVRVVLEAAYKVWHEVHRLLGLLRFSPNEDGVYIAHCEPSHFTLPGLGPHFRERFGQTPWAIIDEKRRLCLHSSGEIFSIDKNPVLIKNQTDNEWENLWRHYHKTINNESRNNPDLQRRFMPKRYWKYLTELR